MYFSVKEPIKIAGKTYIPCVCYSVPSFLELTVNKLVSEGKAVLYNEFVYFQNGKVIENKATKIEKKKTKKQITKEEEIVVNEDISSVDNEGF